jgi:hypothetical protein
MKFLLLSFLLVNTAQAEENFSFCKNKALIISFKESISKLVVESKNYEALISNNNKNAYIIPKSKNNKDSYVPRVEFLLASGKQITFREDSCQKLTIVDFTN